MSAARLSLWGRVWGSAKVRYSCLLIAVLLLLTLGAGWLAPHTYDEMDAGHAFSAPSGDYLLGGDALGRDVLSRTLHGGRMSLAVGLLATLAAVLFGVPIGAFAGYTGGKVDWLTSRLIDLLLPFPVILLAIVTKMVLGDGLLSVVLAISLVLTPFFARVARAQGLSVAQLPFVEAARGSGLGAGRIMTMHVLPHCVQPVLIMAALSVAFAILAEASLNFLGLGLPPPAPSWGGDLQVSMSAFQLAPWTVLAPGFAITLAVLAFNFLGDGLRDAFDVGERFL
jgi:peptide/nickel transport system permease protein